MARGNPWIMFIVVLTLTYLLVLTVLSRFLGIAGLTTNLTVGLLVSIAILFGLKALGLIHRSVPLTRQWAAGGAILALALVFFMPGVLPSIAAPSLTQQAASITPAESVTVPTSGVTVSACEASVSPDIKGTSATLNLNAYNLEEDNPYAAARDTGTLYVFRANSISDASNDNFVTSTADTTANALTGFKVGEVVSFAGGNAGNYTEAKNGVCVSGQQVSVNLDNHHLQTEANYNTTVYDSTGSTEVGSGTQSIDYSRSLGANEVQVFKWKLKNNGADAAIRLCAVGFTWGTNITHVKPSGGDESLFTQIPAPLFAKNVQTPTTYTTETQNPVRKDFTVHKLNQPRLLKEFQEFSFWFETKASANDPVGSVNTTDWSGVNGIMLDCGWSRGSDGKMYDDVHDHSATEANAGRAETLTSPGGKISGFAMTIA